MYRRLKRAGVWHGPDLSEINGHPLVHDILSTLGLLESNHEEGLSTERFEEDCQALQAKFVQNGSISRRRGSYPTATAYKTTHHRQSANQYISDQAQETADVSDTLPSSSIGSTDWTSPSTQGSTPATSSTGCWPESGAVPNQLSPHLISPTTGRQPDETSIGILPSSSNALLGTLPPLFDNTQIMEDARLQLPSASTTVMNGMDLWFDDPLLSHSESAFLNEFQGQNRMQNLVLAQGGCFGFDF